MTVSKTQFRACLDDFYSKAEDDSYTYNEARYSTFLDDVFQTGGKTTPRLGFREVLLLCCAVMMVDPDYRASQDYHACKPRSLAEGPLRDFLNEHGLRHTRSGPINVAKSIKRLDENEWGKTRKPPRAGIGVARLLQLVENDASGEGKTELAVEILRRMIRERDAEQAAFVPLTPTPVTTTPVFLSNLCSRIAAEAADDSGATRDVVGLLLSAMYSDDKLTTVAGPYGGVFADSAIPRAKFGDFDIMGPDRKVKAVLEITTKSFGQRRLEESAHHILSMNEKTQDEALKVRNVNVVCTPDNCPAEWRDQDIAGSVIIGSTTLMGLTYTFLDIQLFISSIISLMSPAQRTLLLGDIGQYANGSSAPPKVKRIWSETVMPCAAM